MAKHWRDQFKDNDAARAAEQERRAERSEGWEPGSDPEPNSISGRRSMQLGARSGSGPRPQFMRAGGKAGFNIRVGGGAPFQTASKPEAGPKAASPSEPSNIKGLTAPESESAKDSAPQKRGLMTKLASLFGGREED